MPLNHLKALVVDDSAIYRKILSVIIDEIEELELSAVCSNGKLALDRLKIDVPDVVFLDIEMPEMNGLETLRYIHQHYPSIKVVMVSSKTSSSASQTVEALRDGAFAFVIKPDTSDPEESLTKLRTNIQNTVRSVLRNKPELPLSQGSKAPSSLSVPAKEIRLLTGKPPRSIGAIGIGISTGGPSALQEIVSNFSESMHVPIFIVQHMPALFTASLAEQLSRITDCEVKEGEHGEVVNEGFIYIAPGGQHMTVKKELFSGNRIIELNLDERVNQSRPSVDVLFHSLSKAYENEIVTFIGTGIGQDGLDGVKSIVNANGYSLTQTKETCTVYGMPKAVAEANMAHEVLPLQEVGPRLGQLISVRTAQ